MELQQKEDKMYEYKYEDEDKYKDEDEKSTYENIYKVMN